MNKFTDGPWEPKKYYHHWTVRAPYISDGETIGTFELCKLSGNREEAYNDVRLIAAAPEMYEFIKVISTGFGDDECDDEFRPDVFFDQMVSTAKELLARIDDEEVKHE